MKGDLTWDLLLEDGAGSSEHGLPPGFRFHPTDEELVTYYLASKVFNGGFCAVDFVEVDLNKCEPWELPDVAKMGEKEWYFFSLRDRKYPTGLRTNRATGAGYWKATGKDREVRAGATAGGALVGMKKTLVFYKGRAPRGEKSKWVLHEYRLEGELSCRHSCKEEWVMCRIFHKSASDKKHPCYQTLAFNMPHQPPSPSPFPQLWDFQTLDNQTLASVTTDLLAAVNKPQCPKEAALCLSKNCSSTLQQAHEEEEAIPSWLLEPYMQTSWAYEALLGGGIPSYDMPLMGPPLFLP